MLYVLMFSPSKSLVLVLAFGLLFASFTHSAYSTCQSIGARESFPNGVTIGQQFDYCVELYPMSCDLASRSVIKILMTDYNSGYLYGEKTYVTSRVYKDDE